jgi:hypothetical protein
MVNWETVGQMRQDKLYGVYGLLIRGGCWTEWLLDRWDKRNFMICTDKWLVVNGELRDSGTDETRETVWFVRITD